jgi:hypothetical protein
MNVGKIERRHARARWWILKTLQAGRPIGANEGVIRGVLDGDFPYSPVELRGELEQMRDLGLIEIIEQDEGIWAAKLTHYGIRVTEYSAPAPAEIARPELKRRMRA